MADTTYYDSHWPALETTNLSTTGNNITFDISNPQNYNATVSGTGSFTKTGTGTLTVGGTISLENADLSKTNIKIQKGIVNLTGTGTNTAYYLFVGATDDTTEAPTFMYDGGSGSFTTGYGVYTGYDGTKGRNANLTMTSGTLNTNYFNSGYDGKTGVVTVSGGTINANSSITVGMTGNGELNISGSDTQLTSKVMNIARGLGGTNSSGTVTLSSGTLNLTGADSTNINIHFASNAGSASSTGTLNLDGGTLQLSGHVLGTSGKTCNINLGGSTIKTVADSTWNEYLTITAKADTATEFNVQANTTTTINSPITGQGGITKSGSGTLELTQVNTYTGTTTITGGTLKFNTSANNITLSEAKIDVQGTDSTLALNGPSIVYLNGTNALNGDGKISSKNDWNPTAGTYEKSALYFNSAQQSGFTGTIDVTANSLLDIGYAGTLTSGTIDLSNTTVSIGSGSILGLPYQSKPTSSTTGSVVPAITIGTLNGSGEVRPTSMGSSTSFATVTIGQGNYSGVIGNASDSSSNTNKINVIKNTTGMLTLSGDNMYTGTTTINGGTLKLTGNGTLGQASSNVSVAEEATLEFGYNTGDTSSYLTSGFNRVIQGKGNVKKSGTSTVILNASNTYTGTTTVTGGTLKFAKPSSGTTLTEAKFDIQGTNSTVALSAGSVIYTDGENALKGNGIVNAQGNWETDGQSTLYFNSTNQSQFTGTIKVDDNSLLNLGYAGTLTSGTIDLSNATISIGSDAVLGLPYKSKPTSSSTGYVLPAINIGTLNGSGELRPTSVSGATTAWKYATVTIGQGDFSGNIGYSDVQTKYNNTINVIKNTTGTLTLSGDNKYTGTTTIQAGTLKLTGNGTLGQATSNVSVAEGATLEFGYDTSTDITFSRVIEGAGNVVKSGKATVTLSASNTYTGSTTISDGTLALSKASTLYNLSGDSSTATLNYGANALTLNNKTIGTSADSVYAGNITGSGHLTKTGTGTLTLSGTISASTAGNLYVREGTLNLTSTGGNSAYNNLFISANNDTTATPAFMYDGGSGSFTTGYGMYTGYDGSIGSDANFTMTSGTINTIYFNSGYGGKKGTVTVSGGTVNATGSITVGMQGVGELNISGTDTKLTSKMMNIARGLGGTDSSGTVTLSSGTLNLTGADNTNYNIHFASNAGSASSTGTLNLDGGTLQLSGHVLGTSGKNCNINLGGSTIKTIADSSWNEYLTITAKANTTTEFNIQANTTTTINSAITGEGNLQKSGAGTLTLSASNYTGSTTISGGTLTLSNVSTLYNLSGDSSTATLNIGNNALTLDSKNIGTSADSVYAGKITGAGNVTKIGTGTLTLTGQNDYSGETFINNGVLRLAGEGSVNGQVTLGDNGTLEISVAGGQTRKMTTSETNKILGTGKVIKSDNGDLKILLQADGQVQAESFLVSSGRLDIKSALIGEDYSNLEDDYAKLDANIEVQGGATLSPGNSVGILNIQGDLTLDSNSILLLEVGKKEGVIVTDALAVSGDIEYEPGSIIQLDLDSDRTYTPQNGDTFELDIPEVLKTALENNQVKFSSYYFQIQKDSSGNMVIGVNPNAVPEPSTWALLILGFAGLMWYRRKK